MNITVPVLLLQSEQRALDETTQAGYARRRRSCLAGGIQAAFMDEPDNTGWRLVALNHLSRGAAGLDMTPRRLRLR